MSEHTLTCPQGHEWQPPSGGSATSENCPVCGAAAETLPVDRLSPAERAAVRAAAYVPTLAVPDYEIEAELGRGGMGVVYRARQISLRRTVALKMAVGGPLAAPAVLARFRTEAEAVARLTHANIVQIYEIGEAAGHAFFSMEFVGGGTLAGRARNAPHAPREAAQTVATLARAVDYAHRQGIVHRDLKPANVLIAHDGTLKIADFGLAKLTTAESSQTFTGDVMGSPNYMAPEQARGATQQIGPACDVYALGAILYELLTGKPPFVGQDTMETILLVLHDEPVPPRRLAPRIGRDLETICLKCLEKSPRLRYDSAASLADDLERFLAGRPVVARPAGPVVRTLKWIRRWPAVATLIFVVVAATATLISYGTWKNTQLRTVLVDTQAHRARAEANFRKALDAADRRLTRAGQDRQHLLAEELAFYDEIRRQPGQDPQIRYERGMAGRRAGDVHRLLGNVSKSRAAYTEAIHLLDELQAQHPTVADYRRDLAAAHDGLGKLLQAAGQLDQAEQQYRQAAKLLERLASDFPDDVDYRRQLGVVWNNLAIAESGLGRAADARAAHQQALALRRRLAAENPRNSSFQLDVSTSLVNLAAVYLKMHETQEALPLLSEALRLRDALPETITAEAEFRLSTAATSNNLGAALAKTGQVNEATDAYRRSATTLAKLAEDYPLVPGYRSMLADAQMNLALHLGANGQTDAAAAALKDAIALWDRLAADDPQTAAYRESADRARALAKDLPAP